MSHESVGKLVDKWLMDAAFRQAVRRDPVGAVKTAGIALTKGELAALQNVDWNLSDEELKSRANKLFG